MAAHPQGDGWVIDLIDRVSGVGIKRAHAWERWDDAEGRRHAVVSLRDLWVYAAGGTAGESHARQLIDGRTVVQIEEDDGSISLFAIDDRGNSVRLSGDELPAADLWDDRRASVGIGVRRESRYGPHLGCGFGGKYELGADLELNRRVVIDQLQQLLDLTREGKLDVILEPENSAPEPS